VSNSLDMTTRSVVAMLAALSVAGCLGGGTRNTNCQWPADHQTRALDLTRGSDARHLADDAQTAEDLAIRHADASRGRDSGLVRNVGEYHRVREECKASLFAIVAQQHLVPLDAVARAVEDRREWLDALVILAFAILFALVAKSVIGLMLRGAIADSRLLAASLLLVAALGAGAISLFAGGVWFGLIESVRVGNGHMSYRVERLPMRRYQVVTFAGGTLIFATIAVLRYRRNN